tara:strand:- start:435 stop:1331 length:897 start_codon:yes stop_codon:yes gene_type:complete
MLVRQPYYREQILSHIMHIKTKKVILTQWLNQGESFIETLQLGAKEMWLFCRKIFINHILQHKQDNLLNNIRLIDIEYPYKKYPAFDFSDLEIDYLIALPSSVFHRDKLYLTQLNVNIQKLIESIPKDKLIFIKQHNVSDKGNSLNVSLIRTNIAKIVLKYIFKSILNVLGRKMWKGENISDYIRYNIAHNYIQNRAISLSEKTKYHNMSIEHFLPFVKEGVITGISTCIYHALQQGLPVYNCDSQPFDTKSPNYDIIKEFCIQPCDGMLEFDSNNFNLVRKSVKRNDMIDLIKKELS